VVRATPVFVGVLALTVEVALLVSGWNSFAGWRAAVAAVVAAPAVVAAAVAARWALASGSAALLLGLAGVAFILVASIDNLRHSRQEALQRGDYRQLTRAEGLNAVALVVIVQFTQAPLLAVM